MTPARLPQAILVLPRLRAQNANAISSPLTHGFPSITAFTGLMWALERKLAQAGVPLSLHSVGVICHRHQEQVAKGFVRTFNLTRNPVGKDGSTAAIVEEGRMHLDVTLVFGVAEKRALGTPPALVQGAEKTLQEWAGLCLDLVSQMRIAGGSVLPTPNPTYERNLPRLDIVAEDAQVRRAQFRQWRRRWLPGYALVGRDDLLARRLQTLRDSGQPDATLLDAWLHASRFNREPVRTAGAAPDGKVRWADPLRGKGSGWIVPIPVGYAALSPLHDAGSVLNARDTRTPLQFVETVYSLGEWIGPHRLSALEHLFWHAEHDPERGLYRCRSGYPQDAAGATDTADDDDEDVYVYSEYASHLD